MDSRVIYPRFEAKTPAVAIETARYYGPPSTDYMAKPAGTFALQNGYLYLIPMVIKETIKFTTIVTYISTIQFGKVCRFGVWRGIPNSHLPGDLIEQTSDISLGVGGAPVGTSLKSGKFEPGYIFVGIASDATTATLTGLDNTQLQALGSTDLTNAPDCHFRKDITWTAGTSLTGWVRSLTYRRQNPPLIALLATR